MCTLYTLCVWDSEDTLRHARTYTHPATVPISRSRMTRLLGSFRGFWQVSDLARAIWGGYKGSPGRLRDAIVVLEWPAWSMSCHFSLRGVSDVKTANRRRGCHACDITRHEGWKCLCAVWLFFHVSGSGKYSDSIYRSFCGASLAYRVIRGKQQKLNPEAASFRQRRAWSKQFFGK